MLPETRDVAVANATRNPHHWETRCSKQIRGLLKTHLLQVSLETHAIGDKKSLFAPFPQLARAVSSRGALKQQEDFVAVV